MNNPMARLAGISFLAFCAGACVAEPKPSMDASMDASGAAPIPDAPIPGAPETPNAPPEIENPFAVSDAAEPDLARKAAFAEAMQDVEERQKVFGEVAKSVVLDGQFVQGGLIFGRTQWGSKVRLDGEPVMVGDDGDFVLGFGRDSGSTALLVVTLPNETVERRSLTIEERNFRVERINGLDQSKVSGFTEAQLEKIGVDREKKNAARAVTQPRADWRSGFDWPAKGRISGRFGSQRILNGEPKRPHSGLDIAAPTGTPVRAPSAGIIRLAESDMYFEGGLILLDHGHWLESAFVHLSRLDVVPGQRVEKGEIIGAIGATGRATGPHLHWSVKWKDRLVDPQLLVPVGGNKTAN
ncbi:MAG: M23 family metallopeptidase [Pseudomonadota bacterium]